MLSCCQPRIESTSINQPLAMLDDQQRQPIRILRHYKTSVHAVPTGSRSSIHDHVIQVESDMQSSGRRGRRSTHRPPTYDEVFSERSQRNPISHPPSYNAIAAENAVPVPGTKQRPNSVETPTIPVHPIYEEDVHPCVDCVSTCFGRCLCAILAEFLRNVICAVLCLCC